MCVNFDENTEGLVCPFGWVKGDVRCGHCPNVSHHGHRNCVCSPCVPACPELSVLNMNGKCSCQEQAVAWGGKCLKLSTVLLQTLVPIILVLFVLFFAYGRYQHYLADTVWKIKAEDLVFDDPAHVLGAGSFGVVLKAQYKGIEGTPLQVVLGCMLRLFQSL